MINLNTPATRTPPAVGQARQPLQVIFKGLRGKRLIAPPPAVPATQLWCHYCGYTCDDVVPPRVCPKCLGSAWERHPVPGSILLHALALEWADEAAGQTHPALGDWPDAPGARRSRAHRHN